VPAGMGCLERHSAHSDSLASRQAIVCAI
jgi:hypothetical protein